MASPQNEPDQGRGAGTTAKNQGREVAGHARSEAEEHAQVLARRADDVAQRAQSEVSDVVDEARDAFKRQADEQSKAAAETIGRVRDDLRAMSDGSSPREQTSQYLQRAAESLDDVVGRLERDGIEGALSGLRSYARRSPTSFLLASAGAGFAAGRLVRNADHPQHVAEQGQGEQIDGRSEIDLRDQETRRPNRPLQAPSREEVSR